MVKEFNNLRIISSVFLVVLIATSCNMSKKTEFTGANAEIKIITLDPGHFHAALVQKEMYTQVDPVVHIYGPEGPDIEMHLKRIDGFNSRSDNPTQWISNIYKGQDFFEKLISENKGNVVVIAGNNNKKTKYIKDLVEAGFNVLSDKPMAIDNESFLLLEGAFLAAKKNKVVLYDIMTERYEITSLLQREIAQIKDIFGVLEHGTPENPAVVKESVHHFYKYVAGSVLKRPAWYFDINSQGEGIVDVTTHLVDLIQWVCFPEKVINYQTDINVYGAKRWTTDISKDQFLAVTGLSETPEFLNNVMNSDSVFQVFANGKMDYLLNGVHVSVSVIWNYVAPDGGADTHFSVMRGTEASLIIRQGKEEGYIPNLFIEASSKADISEWKIKTEKAFSKIISRFPGIELQPTDKGFKVLIPDKYRLGHEAHFAQVTKKYLNYLVKGKLPEWEVPNMISKYYTTTRALELARKEK